MKSNLGIKMTEIVIDPHKCNRDGICAASCPLHLFKIDADTKIPYLDEERADNCINCGHCISVCSQDALTLNGVSPAELTQIDPELMPSPESIEQFLRSRRSIRRYKNKPVDKETLTKLVDLASCSPTGRNEREISWRLVNDKQKMKQLAGYVIDWMRQVSKLNKESEQNFQTFINAWEKGHDSILRDAPALAVAVAPKAFPIATEDGSTAIAYLELAAPSFGLGSCWGGYFYYAANSSAKIQKLLSITEDEKCVGAAMLGYPQFKYYRIPKRETEQIKWV